jgi:NAD(P)-dependent dehydrogenase (short-subunit alcohol dehydrogenase family)
MEVKVALVTGGSSGIGAATARLLASSGIKVYAGSRRGTFEPACEGVVPLQLDVNDTASLEAAVQEILSREGRLDAVVCNAGNGIYGPVEGTTDQEARYQFETNYFGALNTIRACLPVFRARVSVASLPSPP